MDVPVLVEEKKGLELKMYSLVLYQLNGRQIGIQSGHSNVEYGVKYDFNELFVDWARNWKTVIALNGGTSTTLTEHTQWLKDMEIPHATFVETDLYNQITSVSFIADARVFDYELYPDFKDYLFFDGKYFDEKQPLSLLIKQFPVEHETWIETLGGLKNVLFRQWLRPFKLA